MVGEELRYEEGLDTLTVYPGVLSSYPNFMFSLKADEVAEFVAALEQARSPQAFDAIVQRWGIRRTHPQFWRISTSSVPISSGLSQWKPAFWISIATRIFKELT